MKCSCGSVLTPTGVCLDCGKIIQKFDALMLIVALVGIAFLPILALAVPAIISTFELDGTLAATILTALSFVVPISVCADAVFMSIKRKKTHKTTMPLAFGTIGIIIGVVLLLHRLIS